MATEHLWGPDFYPVLQPSPLEPTTIIQGTFTGLSSSPSTFGRPLYCGAAIKSLRSSAIGTLACFILLSGKRVGLLSTSHILASRDAQVGDKIVLVETDQEDVVIASLHSFVMRTERSQRPMAVDAGVALLEPNVSYRSSFPPTFDLPSIRRPRTAQAGEHVFKVGGRSGLTFGEIVDVSVDIRMGPGSELFVDTILIKGTDPAPNFSAPGDSGALVVGADGAPLGMLFAYTSEGFAMAFSMESVCSTLSCRVLTSDMQSEI